jgi:putative membrane protein
MNTNLIKILSRLALLTTAVVWGSSLVVLSLVRDAFAPNMVLAIRFGVASLVLSLIFAPRFKHYDKTYLINGSIIGVFLFIAYSAQTIGVVSAGGAPGRSGFISASYCVIVPFLAWIFLRERPDIYNISAAVLCITGLFFVFYKDLIGSANVGITLGDFYALLSGLLFAAHIVSVAKFGKGKDPILITITQFAMATIISIIVTFLFEDNSKMIINTGSILGVGYLAIMCTAIALLFQTIGQSNTPSSTAAIILGLESIFSIIFAVIWAGEVLSVFSVIGFFFIFIAIIVSETKLSFLKKKK